MLKYKFLLFLVERELMSLVGILLEFVLKVNTCRTFFFPEKIYKSLIN